MKLDEIISNYTHNIIDLNKNSWKVVETSDIEEICKEYHKQQLSLSGVSHRRELLLSYEEWLNEYNKLEDREKQVDKYLAK